MGSKLLKGFRDIYPLADSLIEDSILWSYINKIIRKRLETYNFEEIITPSIENIDTFKKGMGDDTDIVSKEMYEFMLYKDGEIKEDIIYALRPEGTASVVRAYLENSLNPFEVVSLQRHGLVLQRQSHHLLSQLMLQDHLIM